MKLTVENKKSHRLILRHVFAVILLFMAGWSSRAFAQKTCAEVFGSGTKPASLVRPSPDISIPASLLQRHPLSEWAAKLKTSFVVHFKGMGMETSVGQIVPNKVGESLQIRFVNSILHSFFDLKSDSQKIVQFDIRDINEFGSVGLKESDPKILPMHTLKPITKWSTGFSNRHEARKSLGVSDSRKIVHLYIRAGFYVYGRTEAQQGIRRFINEIREAGLFDIVVVSYGNAGREFSYDSEVGKWALPNVTYLKPGLKDILASNSLGDLPHQSVVFNDTKGIMPLIHQISNLAIIGGAINFYEAPQVGTPTISYRKIKEQNGMGGNVDRSQLEVYEAETKAMVKSVPWFAKKNFDRTQPFKIKEVYDGLEDPQGDPERYYASGYYMEKMNSFLTQLLDKIKIQLKE